jgi:hypothetical protein
MIIKFPTNESVDAREIHTKLNAQFGVQTYALHKIQFWVGETQHSREDIHDAYRSGRPALDYINKNNISILKNAPFKSAGSISRVLSVEHATVLHRLQETLGSKSCCLRGVPLLLAGELRAKRKELWELMISYLEAARKDGWR